MSKAAKVSLLEELHDAVAKYLLEAVKSGDELDAKTLDQALKMLKDNGIEAAKDADTSKLKELSERINDLTSDDDFMDGLTH